MGNDEFSYGHLGERQQDTTAALCYSRPEVQRRVALLAAFLMAGCNMPSVTETPAPMAAIIRGAVWHDQCGAEASAGCIQQPGGGYAANGEREAGELGIPGVRVELGEGSCPSTGLGSALTGADGSYAFIGHTAGTYCISVDPLHPVNTSILRPGEWTSPAELAIIVAGGEDLADVDFGWDFQLPLVVGPPPSTETTEPTTDLNLVTANVNANCRAGPGTIYDVVGFLLGGEDAEVEARDAEGSWWQVRLEDSGRVCWISNLTVEISFEPDRIPTVVAPPTPTPSPGSIGGRVWHDECGITGGDPSPGCNELEGGGYAANGLMEQGEPGLSGVLVNLGNGSCPSIGLKATTTGDDGEYLLTGLDGGTYCVSVDAFGAINSTILIPGGWTQPAGDGMAAITITLPDEAQMLSVNFGWDYQFLP
jgi:hypothetical protein